MASLRINPQRESCPSDENLVWLKEVVISVISVFLPWLLELMNLENKFAFVLLLTQSVNSCSHAGSPSGRHWNKGLKKSTPICNATVEYLETQCQNPWVQPLKLEQTNSWVVRIRSVLSGSSELWVSSHHEQAELSWHWESLRRQWRLSQKTALKVSKQQFSVWFRAYFAHNTSMFLFSWCLHGDLVVFIACLPVDPSFELTSPHLCPVARTSSHSCLDRQLSTKSPSPIITSVLGKYDSN